MPKGSQEWVEVRLQNSQASSHGIDELWDFSFQTWAGGWKPPNASRHQADLAERVQPVRSGCGLRHTHALGGPGVDAPHEAGQDLGVAVIEAARHGPELARR